MLVVASGDVALARRMTSSQDRVHVVEARDLLLRLDGANLDLHLASIRQIDRLHGAKYAVLIKWREKLLSLVEPLIPLECGARQYRPDRRIRQVSC